MFCNKLLQTVLFFAAVKIGRMHPDPIVESRYITNFASNRLMIFCLSPCLPHLPSLPSLSFYRTCCICFPSSLSSVEPPQVWFDLKLPQHVIDEVRLSSLQLEAVVYSSQQHMNILADGSRAGFLVGLLLNVTCLSVCLPVCLSV